MLVMVWLLLYLEATQTSVTQLGKHFPPCARPHKNSLCDTLARTHTQSVDNKTLDFIAQFCDSLLLLLMLVCLDGERVAPVWQPHGGA